MAVPTERVFAATPLAAAGGRVIASPFQFWTTGEDNLRIVSVNSLTGVALKVQARFIEADGTIGAASWDHTPASDRTTRTSEFPLGIGAVLNLVVYARSGAPVIGQTYVMVQLIRGSGAAAIVLGSLLAGYVTSTQALAWPGSPIQTSLETGGYYRTVIGTAPAAGAEVNEVVPTGARWELLSVNLPFTTSATVANRHVTLRFFSLSGIFAASLQTNVQTASQASAHCFAANLPITVNPYWPLFQAPLPVNLMLHPGSSFQTLTDALAAGDQFGAPIFEVREWLEVS